MRPCPAFSITGRWTESIEHPSQGKKEQARHHNTRQGYCGQFGSQMAGVEDNEGARDEVGKPDCPGNEVTAGQAPLPIQVQRLPSPCASMASREKPADNPARVVKISGLSHSGNGALLRPLRIGSEPYARIADTPSV